MHTAVSVAANPNCALALGSKIAVYSCQACQPCIWNDIKVHVAQALWRTALLQRCPSWCRSLPSCSFCLQMPQAFAKLPTPASALCARGEHLPAAQLPSIISVGFMAHDALIACLTSNFQKQQLLSLPLMLADNNCLLTSRHFISNARKMWLHAQVESS